MRQSANVNEDVSFEEKRSREEKGGNLPERPFTGNDRTGSAKGNEQLPCP